MNKIHRSGPLSGKYTFASPNQQAKNNLTEQIQSAGPVQHVKHYQSQLVSTTKSSFHLALPAPALEFDYNSDLRPFIKSHLSAV